MISFSNDDLQQVRTYEIDADLKVAEDHEAGLEDELFSEWQPYFHPKTYMLGHQDLPLEHYQLGIARMKKYGEQISRLRSRIRETVARMETDLRYQINDEVQEVSKFAKKVEKWNEEVRL